MIAILVLLTMARTLIVGDTQCDVACESECTDVAGASSAHVFESGVGERDHSDDSGPAGCPPGCQCVCAHHRVSLLLPSLPTATPAVPCAPKRHGAFDFAQLADRGAAAPPTPPPIATV